MFCSTSKRHWIRVNLFRRNVRPTAAFITATTVNDLIAVALAKAKRGEKELPMNKLKKLADYVVRKGTEQTADGRWAVSYDELYYHFGENIPNTNENDKLLKEILRQRDEINEQIMTEDAIEMTYHLEHCPNCQKGGVAGALNLVSLMGCNIYSEHDDRHAALAEEDHLQIFSM